MDWLAIDPEHSYAFCGEKCYLYTYVATRPLRLAYFDGFSGAKAASSGALDTQDIMVWGKVCPDMTSDELARIRELCRWGDQFKLDGFVRYLFDSFLHLAFSLTGVLLSGWKWACEYHASRWPQVN